MSIAIATMGKFLPQWPQDIGGGASYVPQAPAPPRFPMVFVVDVEDQELEYPFVQVVDIENGVNNNDDI
jgi:hypothetical protein